MWPFKKKPEPPGLSRYELVTNTDGWENKVTGVGTWERDKTQFFDFRMHRRGGLSFNWPKLQELYHYDPLSRRIVETWPQHMFRRGWVTRLAGEKAPSSMDRDIAKYVRELGLVQALFEGSVWGRLYGGDLVILGIDDGRPLDQPVDEENIKGIRYINNVDKRYALVMHYYADYKQPNYGKPALYRVFRQISDTWNPTAQGFFDIHESRVIRFEGATTDIIERQILAGWSHSVLTAPWDEMKRFQQVYGSASNLLSDASQGVYKLKGLIGQLGSKQGKQLLEARMEMVDMARSVARSLILDADGEDFTRVQTSFTSVPELMDRFMQMLSMATKIPVTILMGRSAAGMNATGDSDFRAFYSEVSCEQKNYLEPMLHRVYKYITLSKEGPTSGAEKELEFDFLSLWEPTDQERADTNYAQAQADALYVTNLVATPEEIAACRFRGGVLNLNTVVDLAAREKSQEAGKSFDAYPNDPEATDDTAAGGEARSVATGPMPGGDGK